MTTIKDAAHPVELELLAEKAAALGRANESFAAALAALGRADAALAAARPEERAAAIALQRDLRAAAAERLWYLLVQREAIGLYQHEGIIREYQVPAEVRLLAGPRRRH